MKYAGQFVGCAHFYPLFRGTEFTDKGFEASTDQTYMDSRKEPRFSSNQSVFLTNLGVPGDPIPAKIIDFSARGIRLLLDHEIAVGAIVKVSWGKTLLLGQIIYCIPEGAGFSVGMELEEAVYDTGLFITVSDSCTTPDSCSEFEPKSKDITHEQS